MPQKDETTMEEDNSGLLGMMHGWPSSGCRVTRSPPSSQNASCHSLHKLEWAASLTPFFDPFYIFFQEKGLQSRHFKAEKCRNLLLYHYLDK